MRINKVVKQIGLSKRTIYYYIDEQLIFPEINPDNGYYEFSEKDVRTLKLLQQLRSLDFSIKDIQALLAYPQSIHVYLQKQIEKLKREQSLLNEKLTLMKELETLLPPFSISYGHMAQALENLSSISPPSSFDTQDEASDAKLVSLFLWGSFLQRVEMTEYRQYLWDKILTTATASKNPNFMILKQFLYSLPARLIDAEFTGRNRHIETIISLIPDTISEYVQKVCADLDHIIGDEAYLSYWKSCYHNRILPSTILFDSKLNSLMLELSPRFSVYYQNIHSCCDQVYHWLHSDEGIPLKDKILNRLQGYIDIESHHHGVLAALFSLPEYYERIPR